MRYLALVRQPLIQKQTQLRELKLSVLNTCAKNQSSFKVCPCLSVPDFPKRNN
jgi:hypothetical protein